MNTKTFIISVVTLLIDQVTKIGMSIALKEKAAFVVIQNFFSFHYVENYGASWGLLDNKVGLLILISLVALFLFVRFMYNFKPTTKNNIAFGLILGGIFGNLIDRLFLGYVRDFLSFKIINYNYPVFNLADAAIVIGVFLLAIAILKGEDKHADNSTK